ncbi:MAG: hypothetical protein A2Y76_04540 [Planctomycetes bacterium RBG_13_60_9]|nr:MAG: hypothetical protein A2Y76_04540 [Planctomycetes bacterium RBG_13_60_9]
MNEKLVTVARFSDYMKADLARQLLEDEGIKVLVTGQNVANVYGGVPAVADIELQTPENQAEEAREILEANAPLSQGSDEDLESEEDFEEGEDFEEEQE